MIITCLNLRVKLFALLDVYCLLMPITNKNKAVNTKGIFTQCEHNHDHSVISSFRLIIALHQLFVDNNSWLFDVFFLLHFTLYLMLLRCYCCQFFFLLIKFYSYQFYLFKSFIANIQQKTLISFLVCYRIAGRNMMDACLASLL